MQEEPSEPLSDDEIFAKLERIGVEEERRWTAVVAAENSAALDEVLAGSFFRRSARANRLIVIGMCASCAGLMAIAAWGVWSGGAYVWAGTLAVILVAGNIARTTLLSLHVGKLERAIGALHMAHANLETSPDVVQ